MRALVVYESMYGNTHTVAEAIGAGLRRSGLAADVRAVADVGDLVEGVDLVVVGGPTHAHSMSRPSTRSAAADEAGADGGGHRLERGAAGDGVREWLDRLPAGTEAAAAFDTRIDLASALTGRASKAIGRRLRRHGLREVVDPESFLVNKQDQLLVGEAERATRWGEQVGAQVVIGADA